MKIVYSIVDRWLSEVLGVRDMKLGISIVVLRGGWVRMINLFNIGKIRGE